MKKVFFASRRFPFHLVIYPGSGPGFGRAYGWPVETIDEIGTADFDVAIVENRLMEEDIAAIEAYLAGSKQKKPVCFKMSDPEMPRSRDPGVRYILGKADEPNVHYLSVYDPAGPLADFFAGLRRSRILRAPFPYEPDREIRVPIAERSRRVFLSGARHRRVYPLREGLYRRVAWNPWARRLVDRLSALKIGVSDARARLPDRHFVRHAFIGIEQRMDRAVAHGVCGELQSALHGGAHHGGESLGRNEEHTAIGGIGDRIDLTQPPRGPHVGASGEHATIEIDLGADDPDQPILVLEKRVLSHRADSLLYFLDRAE